MFRKLTRPAHQARWHGGFQIWTKPRSNRGRHSDYRVEPFPVLVMPDDRNLEWERCPCPRRTEIGCDWGFGTNDIGNLTPYHRVSAASGLSEGSAKRLQQDIFGVVVKVANHLVLTTINMLYSPPVVLGHGARVSASIDSPPPTRRLPRPHPGVRGQYRAEPETYRNRTNDGPIRPLTGTFGNLGNVPRLVANIPAKNF